ncbi:hypothetical protein IWX47DRAFT_875277 [Phyllosticta citricarpa]
MEELPSVVTAVLRLCCLAQTACTVPCLSLSLSLLGCHSARLSPSCALAPSSTVFCLDCVFLSALFTLGSFPFINDIAALGCYR